MKPFLALGVALLVCGCTVTRFRHADWELERRSFLQRVELGQVSIATNGTATLNGYKNDGGNEALAAAVSAAVSAAIQSVK